MLTNVFVHILIKFNINTIGLSFGLRRVAVGCNYNYK